MDRFSSALFTDFYELTMAQGYFLQGMGEKRAAFEYFFRSSPCGSGFVVFAGLQPLLGALQDLRFQKEEIDYLRSTGKFREEFLGYLSKLRFYLDIYAPEEGKVVFPHEPIIRVEGPLLQVQLVETLVLNYINFQSLIATKAARVVLAAWPDPVLDFGLRRAHGPNGGLFASRSAYIGGCAATSNVQAGKEFSIPVSGTMAHSWVMGFADELSAFRAYAKVYPENPILLVDTYDTLKSGLPNALRVFKEMRERGLNFRPGIRLDSGDLYELSLKALKMLRAEGFENPLIVASGDLDEYKIEELKKKGAAINAWGVGTRLLTSADCPYLSGVYKLAAIKEGDTWKPRIKLSSDPAKVSLPGRCNLWRTVKAPMYAGDYVTLAEEEPENPTDGNLIPLLSLKMREGEPLYQESLEKIRQRVREEISKLPEGVKKLRNPEKYPVRYSKKLIALKKELMKNGKN